MRAFAVLVVVTLIATRTPAPASCSGDCDADGVVTISEIMALVCMALGGDAYSTCPSVATNEVTIDEIIAAVNNALTRCPLPAPTTTATSTPTPPLPTATPSVTVTPGGEEFVAQATDFECLTSWTKVRHYRVVNKLDHGADALFVASSSYDVSGLEFPVGTIIQLIPTEAMVKRGGGFDPANHDWEYFSLKATSAGTTILTRGRDEVVNFAGGNCFSCHAAATRYDFVCETNHGCVPIPLTDDLVNLLQTNDPRCQH